MNCSRRFLVCRRQSSRHILEAGVPVVAKWNGTGQTRSRQSHFQAFGRRMLQRYAQFFISVSQNLWDLDLAQHSADDDPICGAQSSPDGSTLGVPSVFSRSFIFSSKCTEELAVANDVLRDQKAFPRGNRALAEGWSLGHQRNDSGFQSIRQKNALTATRFNERFQKRANSNEARRCNSTHVLTQGSQKRFNSGAWVTVYPSCQNLLIIFISERVVGAGTGEHSHADVSLDPKWLQIVQFKTDILLTLFS